MEGDNIHQKEKENISMMLELVLLLTLHTFALLYLRSTHASFLPVLRRPLHLNEVDPIKAEGSKEYKTINVILIASFGLEILLMGIYGHQHALMLEAPVSPEFHSIVTSTYVLMTLMVIVPAVSIPLLIARLNVLKKYVTDIEEFVSYVAYEDRYAIQWFVDIAEWADGNQAVNTFMKEQNSFGLTGVEE